MEELKNQVMIRLIDELEELKNRAMIRLIDELIETLEQIKYEQRLYLEEQIKKLNSMKQDIEREDLN